MPCPKINEGMNMTERKILIAIILITICVVSVVYAFSLYYLNPQNVIKVAIPSEIRTLNELNVLNNIEMFITDLMYDPLAEPDPTTLEPRGYLAESWEWDSSRQSCTVNLRTNVRWHDGVPFTADDVKFWYDVEKEFKIPKFYQGLTFIKNIEVVDDHTIRFVLSEAHGTIPFGDLIFPKHIWEPVIQEARKKSDPLKYLLDYPNTNPIGTGPYKFVEMVAGSHVKLNTDPDFYREKIHIDGIFFQIFASLDDAVLALQNGEVDYIAKPLEPKHVALLENSTNVKIWKSPSKELHYMAFNLRKEPFNDTSFRKAVAYLVDKTSLCDELLNYTGKPLYSVVPSGFSYWHNPNVATYELPTKTERMQAARDILTNANYTWIDGKLVMPSGSLVQPFNLLTPSAAYDSIRANAGIRIASCLEEMGIPVTAKEMPLTNLTLMATSHDFDIYISGWELPLGPYYLYHMFHSSNAIVGGFNTAGYCSPEFDALIEKEEKELETETRRNLVFQAQEMLANDLPVIPLYERDMYEATSDRFEGWVGMLGGIMNTWSFTYIYPTKKT